MTDSRLFRKIALVIPCYNEALRLKARDFTQGLDLGLDFLFVNDGSHDKTLEILSQIKETCPDRIQILGLSSNCGKAEAVRQGMKAAISLNYSYVGYWDADLSAPLS